MLPGRKKKLHNQPTHNTSFTTPAGTSAPPISPGVLVYLQEAISTWSGVDILTYSLTGIKEVLGQRRGNQVEISAPTYLYVTLGVART